MRHAHNMSQANASCTYADNSSRFLRSPSGYELSSPRWSLSNSHKEVDHGTAILPSLVPFQTATSTYFFDASEGAAIDRKNKSLCRFFKSPIRQMPALMKFRKQNMLSELKSLVNRAVSGYECLLHTAPDSALHLKTD